MSSSSLESSWFFFSALLVRMLYIVFVHFHIRKHLVFFLLFASSHSSNTSSKTFCLKLFLHSIKKINIANMQAVRTVKRWSLRTWISIYLSLYQSLYLFLVARGHSIFFFVCDVCSLNHLGKHRPIWTPFCLSSLAVRRRRRRRKKVTRNGRASQCRGKTRSVSYNNADSLRYSLMITGKCHVHIE